MENIIEFINDLGINFWKLKILNFFFEVSNFTYYLLFILCLRILMLTFKLIFNENPANRPHTIPSPLKETSPQHPFQ